MARAFRTFYDFALFAYDSKISEDQPEDYDEPLTLEQKNTFDRCFNDYLCNFGGELNDFFEVCEDDYKRYCRSDRSNPIRSPLLPSVDLAESKK